MIRISITSAAFDAIKATLPVGSATCEPQRDGSGQLFHLDPSEAGSTSWKALRQPGEEDLSETIIRLVAMEAGVRRLPPDDGPCSARRIFTGENY